MSKTTWSVVAIIGLLVLLVFAAVVSLLGGWGYGRWGMMGPGMMGGWDMGPFGWIVMIFMCDPHRHYRIDHSGRSAGAGWG
jgi:hypothetical protein